MARIKQKDIVFLSGLIINNMLCYLYLENKTFINAHLIKNGLVQADRESDFKYKEKFIKLYEDFVNENNQNIK